MTEINPQELLSEVSRWSIEAKEENSDRYFFHFRDVELIEKGQKNYVIGRKGTGKTAIAEYINNQKSFNIFSKILSFGNFPFNTLYEFENQDYTNPNQYITIWEYVICNCVCSMMAGNATVNRACPINLSTIFDIDIEKALTRSLKKITAPGFGINLFGVEFSKSPGIEVNASRSWRENVDGIWEFITKYIDDSTYYIMFDALDEDYKDVLQPDRKQKYFELLVSLFKATQNIRFRAGQKSIKIIPIIFLRDDIFDLCRDPDKNKWLDRSVRLRWDTDSLESLLAFRISRAATPNGSALPLGEAWSLLFSASSVRVNRRFSRHEEAFKFILRSTYHRPRDIINFTRSCAEIALNKNSPKISSEIIKLAEIPHSEYMRREIIDEMYSAVDDISEIIDLFSDIRKPILSKSEFDSHYENFYKNSGRKPVWTSEEMIKLLYHFNVIGNVTIGNHQVYAYNTYKKSINLRENICVHRGLLKCLHIL